MTDLESENASIYRSGSGGSCGRGAMSWEEKFQAVRDMNIVCLGGEMRQMAGK
jgi:hypothetical protein